LLGTGGEVERWKGGTTGGKLESWVTPVKTVQFLKKVKALFQLTS
jgi:hypothetical protein